MSWVVSPAAATTHASTIAHAARHANVSIKKWAWQLGCAHTFVTAFPLAAANCLHWTRVSTHTQQTALRSTMAVAYINRIGTAVPDHDVHGTFIEFVDQFL